jgi:hypothetical protein
MALHLLSFKSGRVLLFLLIQPYRLRVLQISDLSLAHRPAVLTKKLGPNCYQLLHINSYVLCNFK